MVSWCLGRVRTSRWIWNLPGEELEQLSWRIDPARGMTFAPNSTKGEEDTHADTLFANWIPTDDDDQRIIERSEEKQIWLSDPNSQEIPLRWTTISESGSTRQWDYLADSKKTTSISSIVYWVEWYNLNYLLHYHSNVSGCTEKLSDGSLMLFQIGPPPWRSFLR